MPDDPAITFGPLQVWIAGRRFSDATDFWDGNWLTATARCVGVGSVVEVTGTILHLDELRRWHEKIVQLEQTLDGRAELPTLEPSLKVTLCSTGIAGTGLLAGEIEITGDPMSESHRFQCHVDQSYLPGLRVQLAAILREYPILRDGRS